MQHAVGSFDGHPAIVRPRSSISATSRPRQHCWVHAAQLDAADVDLVGPLLAAHARTWAPPSTS